MPTRFCYIMCCVINRLLLGSVMGKEEWCKKSFRGDLRRNILKKQEIVVEMTVGRIMQETLHMQSLVFRIFPCALRVTGFL